MELEVMPYGDRAVLINLSQKIDLNVNRQILALTAYTKTLAGVLYQTPAYCSLTVIFDPTITNFDKLSKEIKAYSPTTEPTQSGRNIRIPVCYDKSYSPDMDDVAKATGLSTAEIIEQHTSTNYHVYMMGFIPGFAYMGKSPEQIYCSRKDEPRRQVPAGSVGLAGLQSGIYPSEAPGGWQLIGKTPIKTFLASSDDPFLFRTGDQVKFQEISLKEFNALARDVNKNTFNIASLYA